MTRSSVLLRSYLALLEGTDHLISERKANALPVADGTEDFLEGDAWSYDGNEHPKEAYRVGSTTFGYQLLHDWKGSLLKFRASSELFDVDAAMRSAGASENYKERMWKQLSAREQRFVASFRHESTVARVSGWKKGDQLVDVQPARYSDQMVTNHKIALRQDTDGRRIESFGFHFESIDTDYVGRSCSLPSDYWQAQWEEVEHTSDGDFIIRKKLLSYENSPFSNTIGVACVLITADDRWVISLRAGNVAYDPQTLGCPASGALGWSERSRWSGRNVDTWVKEGLARECKEELGLTPSQDQIKYLAFCRELARAGKPQFFSWST